MKKYGIYAVHYFESDKTKHIEKVKVISCYASWELGDPEELATKQVIDLINKDYEITTLIKKDGEWHKGSKVEVYDEKYIRSNNNSTDEDNLANLPTY